MKITILTLVLAVGTLPVGYAQTQSSTTEKTEQNTQTTTKPDGTAVHHAQSTHEKTDSNVNPDGSSSTVHTRESKTHTKVKSDGPVDSKTTEHKSSSSTTTTTSSPTIPPK